MISVFDIFSIGIGPSSSHTVGPMRAAKLFVQQLNNDDNLEKVHRLKAELFGSLGQTGKGHGSDKALVMGLEGENPETVNPDSIPERMENILKSKKLKLAGSHTINFRLKDDLVFNKRKKLPKHPNGMTFTAFDSSEKILLEKSYYSIGGGFLLVELKKLQQQVFPYPFERGIELLEHCKNTGKSISQLMMENELTKGEEDEVRHKILEIWNVMNKCIIKGYSTEGILPGGLDVKRRAPQVYKRLRNQIGASRDSLSALDWVDLYALAVNEENAAGGKVVTAPTNGAAGIIPAVLKFHLDQYPHNKENDVVRFLLTAASIGMLFKMNGSISGAEVGCQGEVGVACSMAAAGLTEVMGGTPEQVENAAEIGMEHNLGLTCDPIGGLVQVPCIERNAMGAVKAINASRLALRGDGEHHVSLDKVIQTMLKTGRDMHDKYKETSRGGLAVNIVEC